MKKEKNSFLIRLKKMRQNPKERALLKLICWAIFFLIVLIFCAIASFSPKGKKNIPKTEPPVEEKENLDTKKTLTSSDIIVLTTNIKNQSFDYNITVTNDSSKYIFNGSKSLTSELGYKEANGTIIKYHKTSEGIFDETSGTPTPISNLYEGLNPKYMDWTHLFDFINSHEYLQIEPNTYHMASEITDIYLTITASTLTNIKISNMEPGLPFSYEFTFKNIGGV